MRVVLPNPDSPKRKCKGISVILAKLIKPTNNHNGEVSTTFCDNLVPLFWLNASEILVSLATVRRRTWFGKLAMPIPSAGTGIADMIKVVR